MMPCLHVRGCSWRRLAAYPIVVVAVATKGLPSPPSGIIADPALFPFPQEADHMAFSAALLSAWWPLRRRGLSCCSVTQRLPTFLSFPRQRDGCRCCCPRLQTLLKSTIGVFLSIGSCWETAETVMLQQQWRIDVFEWWSQ